MGTNREVEFIGKQTESQLHEYRMLIIKNLAYKNKK